MEFNLAKHKAMTDAEDKYRKEHEPQIECADCDEPVPESELEDGICEPCWKKREQIEAMEER